MNHEQLRALCNFQYWLGSNYRALTTSADQMTDRAIKYVQMQGQNLPIQDVVRSASNVIEIGTKVQMTKREWWQIYRKGWHKHNDHWGRKWWIRYNWNT